MDSKSWRHGWKQELFAAVLAGAVFAAGGTALAAEEEQKTDQRTDQGIEQTAELSGPYMNFGFSDVDEGSFLYIRSEPTRESEWVGKLYRDQAARIAGPIEEWTRIESGSVTGYVKTEFLLTGEAARQKAKEAGEPEALSYAESKEEEAVRLAEEEAARQREAEEAVQAYVSMGQAVVDYACQFIGNPYVWGGTSLTDGADCSGFVQSVYAQFGVSMPRTSGEMRSAGREVASYEQALPGDVFCYEGHVGIYMGNGQIVNAIDDAHGIGISNAVFTNIITIRRLL